MAHTISTQLARSQSRAEELSRARGRLLRAITDVHGVLHEITEGSFQNCDPLEGSAGEAFLGDRACSVDGLGEAANGVWAVDAVRIDSDRPVDNDVTERAVYDIVLAYASLRTLLSGAGRPSRRHPDAITIIHGASQALHDAHRTLTHAWRLL